MIARQIGYVSPNKTYSRGKKCAQEGCTTLLNQYNPYAHCYKHQTFANTRHRISVRAKPKK